MGVFDQTTRNPQVGESPSNNVSYRKEAVIIQKRVIKIKEAKSSLTINYLKKSVQGEFRKLALNTNMSQTELFEYLVKQELKNRGI